MTPIEGIAKIKKLLGKTAVWRDNKRRTSPEERAEVRARLNEIKARIAHASEAMKRRQAELLASDAEYQTLLTLYRNAQNDQKQVHAEQRGGYRLMAGKNGGFAVEVRAEADNWAELVRAVEKACEPGQVASVRLS